MMPNRTRRTAFRGRAAATADAPFFADGTGGRTRAHSQASASIAPAEEAESRARWTRALVRQKLRGAVTRTEKVAGGIYAAALMVLLGHEWPHSDAANDSHPTGGTHDIPAGSTETPATLGQIEAAPEDRGDGLPWRAADDGSTELHKVAHGTTIIPTTVSRAVGDHEAGMPGEVAGGVASHLGHAAEMVAIRSAEPIVAMNEASLPVGHAFTHDASVESNTIINAARPAAQESGAADTAQGHAKAVDGAATIEASQDHGRSQSDHAAEAQDVTTAEGELTHGPGQGQPPAKAQDVVAAADEAAHGQSQSQSQSHSVAKAQDAAAIVEASQDYGQGQSHAKTQDVAAATGETAHGLGQSAGVAKAQDVAATAEVNQDHGQGQSPAKTQDVAATTGETAHGHGQSEGAAKMQDIAAATVETIHGLGQGQQGQPPTKAQDIAAAAGETAHGHGQGEGEGAAKVQDIAAATVEAIHDLGQGQQGQGFAKAQDVATIIETAHGHGQSQPAAKAQDVAAVEVVLVGGRDHGPGHSDHAETFLIPQAGEADATDTLSAALLADAGGVDSSIMSSMHPSITPPEEFVFHGGLRSAVESDLSII